jgi:hypothetical protein
MNRLISSRLVMFLGLLITSMSIVPEVSYAQTSPSKTIWGCSAGNSKLQYVVDQLDRNANSFDLAIYKQYRADGVNSEAQYANYIGTVQVNVVQKEPELLGNGSTYKSTFIVNAFGRTVNFTIRDSSSGEANGRCYVQWEMSDSKTRQMVRQCLALAARKYGGVAEVTRNGCIGDPSATIEEIQRRN